MERIATTYLYDKDGRRFRCNVDDVEGLMEKKGWKQSLDDFKRPSGSLAKKDDK